MLEGPQFERLTSAAKGMSRRIAVLAAAWDIVIPLRLLPLRHPPARFDVEFWIGA
ncbi:MAG TPA: hypothetical protein VGP12_04410 [Nitrosospira sp.]|jgi:hypothetical protein|nr:hypothetical protein [Nitrosospira sp.]